MFPVSPCPTFSTGEAEARARRGPSGQRLTRFGVRPGVTAVCWWPGRAGWVRRVTCSFEMSRATCPLHSCTHTRACGHGGHPNKGPTAVTPRTPPRGYRWHPQNGPWGPGGQLAETPVLGLGRRGFCRRCDVGWPAPAPGGGPCHTAGPGPAACGQPGAFACSRWQLDTCFSTPCCPALWPVPGAACLGLAVAPGVRGGRCDWLGQVAGRCWSVPRGVVCSQAPGPPGGCRAEGAGRGLWGGGGKEREGG